MRGITVPLGKLGSDARPRVRSMEMGSFCHDQQTVLPVPGSSVQSCFGVGLTGSVSGDS